MYERLNNNIQLNYDTKKLGQIFMFILISILIISLTLILSLMFPNNDVEINKSKYKINAIKNEKIKNFEIFKVSFNSTLRLPNYVLYNFNSKGSRCSSNYCRKDEYLNTRTYNSFTNTKFDRGHLMPATFTNRSCITFNMANIVPQIHCFNAGTWLGLENYVRNTFLGQNILTVPEYDNEHFISDQYDEPLAIPIGFYEIVFDDNYENILFSVYINHTEKVCGKNFREVGNFDKLPYFISYEK
ncbi:MAG: DNA/RNA endonuclease [Satyrvirus sp.]|uniref:DNA/RNA endonuclease n=1 Tax=Satyrvirus sp. TaxID=2487771 RepID=A0A3G5AIV1_9VIRU|nr:MAG: DNA/RNA endonuclease [Satyrvirus sp.]